MTIEELNRKLERINDRLDGVISEMYVTYDKDKLTSNVNALQSEILGDPKIKSILTSGTPEDRRAFMEAIENGAKSVREKIAALRDNDSMTAHRSELAGLHTSANKQVFDVASSIRDAEKIDFADTGRGGAYTQRNAEIMKKKKIVDGLLNIEGKVSDAKGALTSAGLLASTDDIIQEVERLETARKKCAEDLGKCNALVGVNFKELVDKLDNLLKDSSTEMDDDELKKIIKDLKKNCYKFDDVYPSPPSMPGVKPTELCSTFASTNFSDRSQLEAWVTHLRAKVEDPSYGDILSDKYALYSSLEERFEIIREKFSNEVDSSIVLSKLVTDSDIDNLRRNPKNTDKLLEQIKTSLRDYQKYMEGTGLNRATLVLQKGELDKKATAYTDISMDKKSITIDGKSLSFASEMLDPNVSANKYRDYLSYIDGQTTTEGQAFRDSFKSAVTTAIGRPRPTNKWYHKLGEWITFGGYQSPETKYDIEYRTTAVGVLKDAITEKKTRLDDATRVVGNDTAAYRREVIERAVTEKKKVTNRDKKDARKGLDAFEK